MNRSTLFKAAAAVCVVALLACGLAILFGSLHIGLSYADAEQYAVGGAEVSGAVKNLDIHWVDGEVNIAYHDKDTVELSETAPKALNDKNRLRWWLDGDTLRVQYAQSGYFALRNPDKALTVTLPEGMVLGVVTIEATSGNVTVPDLEAERVKVGMTSGDLSLRQSGESEIVEVSCTSGDVDVAVDDVDALNISGTSGGIRASLGNAKAVRIGTTSGSVSLTGGKTGETEIGNTSGNIGVALAAFDALRINSTSGSVTAELPAEPGFTADIDTTSGHVDYTLSLAREGNRYVCGDGSGSLTIDTTSGSVLLKEISQ